MGKSDFFSLGKKLRSVEKDLTKGLIKWRVKREGLPSPDEETLDRGSEHIVNEAHRIMKRGGKRIFEELKLAKREFLKAYRDEGEKKGE
jgi:hypothetical protein